MTVTENQEIFLEVKVNKPGQSPVWTLENKEVSSSKHIQLTSEGLIHRLVIKTASLDDEGVYKVAFGDKKSSANVLVDGELSSGFNNIMLHFQSHFLQEYFMLFC